MLIAKGYSVSFEMMPVDGKKKGPVVRAPRGAALLHDPTGRDWPSCSGLVVIFSRRRAHDRHTHGPRGGREIWEPPLAPSAQKDAEEYLGRAPLFGHASPPPKALASWKLVGDVAIVNYRRIGAHANSYYHPIEKGNARLYRRGAALRVELGRGCEWNWRGIVKP